MIPMQAHGVSPLRTASNLLSLHSHSPSNSQSPFPSRGRCQFQTPRSTAPPQAKKTRHAGAPDHPTTTLRHRCRSRPVDRPLRRQQAQHPRWSRPRILCPWFVHPPQLTRCCRLGNLIPACGLAAPHGSLRAFRHFPAPQHLQPVAQPPAHLSRR